MFSAAASLVSIDPAGSYDHPPETLVRWHRAAFAATGIGNHGEGKGHSRLIRSCVY